MAKTNLDSDIFLSSNFRTAVWKKYGHEHFLNIFCRVRLRCGMAICLELEPGHSGVRVRVVTKASVGAVSYTHLTLPTNREV